MVVQSVLGRQKCWMEIMSAFRFFSESAVRNLDKFRSHFWSSLHWNNFQPRWYCPQLVLPNRWIDQDKKNFNKIINYLFFINKWIKNLNTLDIMKTVCFFGIKILERTDPFINYCPFYLESQESKILYRPKRDQFQNCTSRYPMSVQSLFWCLYSLSIVQSGPWNMFG